MEQRSLNILGMQDGVGDYMTQNAASYAGYAPIGPQVTALILTVTNRKLLLTGQQTQSQGATVTKSTAQKKASQQVADIAALANGYSLVVNDTDLYVQTKRSSSYILSLPDDQGVAVMKQVLAVVGANAAALVPYGIVSADLTAAQAAVAAAETMLNAPRKVISKKKTEAQLIRVEERAAAAILRILDRLMKYFKRRNPAFYLGYLNARVVVDLGGGGSTPPQAP